MKKLVLTILSIALTMFAVQTAYAAGSSSCQIIYGGGQVCQEQLKFTINKLVQKPGKGGGDFVENLTVNDPRFAPREEVNFKISIKNTGNSDITNLNIVDTFPQFLTFVAGVGVANVGASQINFMVGKIAAGQTLDYVITAKIADAGSLPNNQAVTCVTNNVTATASDGTQASDNAQLCIEKQVLGAVPTPQILEKPFVKQIPATGPELGALFGLIPVGALGFYLRKKA